METKSKAVQSHQPCPCGTSSDAYTLYDDGHGWCYSCGEGFNMTEKEAPVMEFSYQFVPWRGISAETMRFYGVKGKVNSEGKPVAFAAPFGENGPRQIRLVEEKKTWWQGEGVGDAGLFGQDRFEGGGKEVTIFEGWIDAASGYELLHTPCVALKSATSARKDCQTAWAWLNSFQRIYIATDSDEPGQKAAEVVAGMFDFNKIYHVKMRRKDCNEYLTNQDHAGFQQAHAGASRFLPEGIASTAEDFRRILREDRTRESIPYPFPSWNAATDGIRPHEFVLISADEGVGKTEIFRAIEYHVLSTTPESVGTSHLEEDEARQLQGIAGYVLRTPCHIKDASASPEDIENAVVQYANRLHLYSHVDSDDPDLILDRLRFLGAACGCRRLFLDNLSVMVASLEDDDERRKLDYLAARIARMVKQMDVTIFVAAHVNAAGRIRGSTGPSKFCHTWFHLHRNILAETEEERNRTQVILKKNRLLGKTGPIGILTFNHDTFQISENAEGLPT